MGHRLQISNETVFAEIKALFFKIESCTLINGFLTITFLSLGESSKQTAEVNEHMPETVVLKDSFTA